jgi:hypothetical protein
MNSRTELGLGLYGADQVETGLVMDNQLQLGFQINRWQQLHPQ